MTEARRLEEIRERQRRGEPLNLSAIQIECPHLLDGLFDPAGPGGFRGWRETLEAAGVAVERMVVSPLVEVECLHCGYRAEHLSQHLRETHGQTAAEYRQEFRAGETQSEELRAERMGLRHGRPAKIVMPHWEPAWSELYALDRLHYCHLHGYPANRAYWTKSEPGLEAYLRRLFVHWEPALEAIGLDPERERAAKKIIHDDDRAEIRRRLRELSTSDPRALRPVSAPLMRHRGAAALGDSRLRDVRGGAEGRRDRTGHGDARTRGARRAEETPSPARGMPALDSRGTEPRRAADGGAVRGVRRDGAGLLRYVAHLDRPARQFAAAFFPLAAERQLADPGGGRRRPASA